MSKIKVYLAGGIDGLSYEQATGWRKKATEMLEKMDCEVIQPIVFENEDANFTSEKIVLSDYKSVQQADVLLVEMNTPGHAYIGTSIEIHWAWEQVKPVIVWGTANRCSHFLQFHAMKIVDTLEEAIEVIENIKKEGY